MYCSIILISIIISILIILLFNIEIEIHQIIIFLSVLIGFTLFKIVFGYMIKHNKNNIYGTSNTSNTSNTITNYSVNPINNNLNNTNNTNNTNSGNNVSLNNEQLVRIGINNLDEYSKYKTLRYKNMQVESDYSPIVIHSELEFNTLHNPNNFSNNNELDNNTLIKKIDCADNGSCIQT